MLEEFALFAGLLNERLLDGAHMSEDDVRYSFYLAAVQRGSIYHSDLSLEHPHPAIPHAHIDTLIHGDTSPRGTAIEFKYDRSNPGGTNQNRTQRAGSFLADLFRLGLIPDELAMEKFFVYLTDQGMASYFLNPSNDLSRLYNIEPGDEFHLGPNQVSQLASSAVRRVEDLIHPCTIVGYYRNDLGLDHQLRIFQVFEAA